MTLSMRRVATAVASAAVLTALASAAPGQTPAQTGPDADRPVFRGGANVVLVDAYPKAGGKILEGLTRNDFEVFEDGRLQAIENVEFVRVAPSLAETARRDPNGLRDMYAQAADPRNRVFVVFLDTPHVPVEGGNYVRRPLVDALNRIVGANDLFAVTTPNQRATDLTLGRRAQTIEDQLARHWTWGQGERAQTDPQDPIEEQLRDCFEFKHQQSRRPGQPEQSLQVAPWIVDDAGVRRPFYEILIERRREDRVFTSLENLVSHLGSMREARSAVLPITRGWRLVERNQELAGEPFREPEDRRFVQIPQGPGGDSLGLLRPVEPGSGGQRRETIEFCKRELDRLAGLDHPRRLRDLVDRSNRNNVSMFPVNVLGLEASDTRLVYRDDVARSQTVVSQSYVSITNRVEMLRTLAEGTGGSAVVNTNDLGAGLAKIADELSSYYLLAYSPANTRRDGRYRRIEVRVKVPGASVRARPGYVAAEAFGPTNAAASSPDAAALAVEGALGALGRARSTNEMVTAASVEADAIVAVVELGPAFVAAGWGSGASVQVEAFGPGGTKVGPVLAAIEPGTRGVALRLPVASPDGPWRVVARVTGPRTMQDGVEAVRQPAVFLGGAAVFRATPSPRSPLRPVADLLFSRTERLHVEWPVLRPSEMTTVRLLDRQGRALPVTLSAIPGRATAATGGGPVVVVDLNLSAFPEGDYVLEVRSTEGPAVERKLQAFRVVR